MIKFNKTSLSFLLSVLSLSVSITSCSQLRLPGANVGNSNGIFGGGLPNNTASNPPSSEKQLLTKKFNAYVECANDVNERVLYDYQDYVRYTKDQPLITGNAGTNAKSNSSWSAPTLGFVSEYNVEKVEALKKAVDSAPPIDSLDGIGRSYVSAFDKVHSLTKEAANYYKQKDYKDDNFKRAREMHAPLLAAFSDFEKVSAQMSDEIDRLEDGYQQNDFAELEKQNVRDVHYEILNLRINAKQLYRAAKASDVTLEKFDPLLQKFSQIIDEVKNFVRQQKEKNANTPYGGGSVGLEYSDGTVFGETFQIEAKEFARHLRDEHKIPESGSGSLKALTDDYNNLVNALNSSSANWNTNE